ncbi:ABC transporter permease, partial [Rhodovulum sulfidophilum]|nr:ABC transporter permease [Rhodovulum sulfidophilum]
TVFGVPFTGSLPALAASSFLYVFATTGFGQLISAFTRSQVAAVFATSVLSIIPAVNFSGLILPVASLDTPGRLVGQSFPSAWYQAVTNGTFLKGFGWAEIAPNAAVLAGFCMIYLSLAILGLRKQEA